jgi:hypothetical protein
MPSAVMAGSAALGSPTKGHVVEEEAEAGRPGRVGEGGGGEGADGAEGGEVEAECRDDAVALMLKSSGWKRGPQVCHGVPRRGRRRVAAPDDDLKPEREELEGRFEADSPRRARHDREGPGVARAVQDVGHNDCVSGGEGRDRVARES